jgi:enoyl-[acyl-carrier-protein] reductase (NADH)
MLERLKELKENEIKAIYLKLVHSIDANNEQLLMNFFGTISDDLINSLGQSMEDLLISYSVSKKLINKLFSIIVEGLKNILLYGEKTSNNEKIGFVIVLKTTTSFKVLFGNLITQKVQPTLEVYLGSIANMSAQQLNKTYIETLETTFVKDVRTSGVGLLVMAMKSDGKLVYQFNEIDEQRYLFTTEVTLDRIEK